MVELIIQCQDHKDLHVGIKFEFNNEDELRQALENAVPIIATKALTTVYVNTLDWKFGIAKVQQNAMIERGNHYNKTGN
jgi:hypothetical protein